MANEIHSSYSFCSSTVSILLPIFFHFFFQFTCFTSIIVHMTINDLCASEIPIAFIIRNYYIFFTVSVSFFQLLESVKMTADQSNEKKKTNEKIEKDARNVIEWKKENNKTIDGHCVSCVQCASYEWATQLVQASTNNIIWSM